MASVGEETVASNAVNMCENVTQPPRDVNGSTHNVNLNQSDPTSVNLNNAASMCENVTQPPRDINGSTHNVNLNQSDPTLVNLNEQICTLLDESVCVSERCDCDKTGTKSRDPGKDVNANETDALKAILEDKIRAFLELELIHEQYHREWVEFSTHMWQFRHAHQPRDVNNTHVTDRVHHATAVDQSEAATCQSLDSVDTDALYRDGGDAQLNTATCSDCHQKGLYMTEGALNCQYEYLVDKKAAIWNRFLELEHDLRSLDDEDIVPLHPAHAHTDLSKLTDLAEEESDDSDMELVYDPEEHGRNLHRCTNSLDLSEIHSQFIHGDSIDSTFKEEFGQAAAAAATTDVERLHDGYGPYTNVASDTDIATGCKQYDMTPVYKMDTGRMLYDMTPVTDPYRGWTADNGGLAKKLSEATAISGSDRDGPEGDQQATPAAVLKDVGSLQQLKRSSNSRLSDHAVIPQTSSDNDVTKKSSSTVNQAGDQLTQANSYAGNISSHTSSFSKFRKRFSGLMSRTMRVKSVSRAPTSGSTKRSSEL